MRALRVIVAVLGVGVAANGCSNVGDGLGGNPNHACTLIGCSDGVSVHVANADGTFPAGTHLLEVDADGVRTSCTFPLPPETVAGGGTLVANCLRGLSVVNLPLSQCTGTATSTMSQTCTPIAGTIREEIVVEGTPSVLRLRQTVDGTVIFDKTISPEYRTTQPNGPDCGPICQQASTSWTFSGL